MTMKFQQLLSNEKHLPSLSIETLVSSMIGKQLHFTDIDPSYSVFADIGKLYVHGYIYLKNQPLELALGPSSSSEDQVEFYPLCRLDFNVDSLKKTADPIDQAYFHTESQYPLFVHGSTS